MMTEKVQYIWIGKKYVNSIKLVAKNEVETFLTLHSDTALLSRVTESIRKEIPTAAALLSYKNNNVYKHVVITYQELYELDLYTFVPHYITKLFTNIKVFDNNIYQCNDVILNLLY